MTTIDNNYTWGTVINASTYIQDNKILVGIIGCLLSKFMEIFYYHIIVLYSALHTYVATANICAYISS